MAGRRAVETAYGTMKMFAMMKLRLTEFYKDPVVGAGLAAMAIGARDAKYAPYREARLPATKYAKAADLYGSFTGQVQAAIMNIKRLGIDLAEDKCKAIYAYVDTHGLETVKIGNYTAGDAVLAYFGCIELPKPSAEAAEEAAVSDVESEIEKALEAKRAGVRTGATAGAGAGPSAQQQAVETNVEEVEKNAEKAAEQTIQQASGQAAQQTG